MVTKSNGINRSSSQLYTSDVKPPYQWHKNTENSLRGSRVVHHEQNYTCSAWHQCCLISTDSQFWLWVLLHRRKELHRLRHWFWEGVLMGSNRIQIVKDLALNGSKKGRKEEKPLMHTWLLVEWLQHWWSKVIIPREKCTCYSDSLGHSKVKKNSINPLHYGLRRGKTTMQKIRCLN